MKTFLPQTSRHNPVVLNTYTSLQAAATWFPHIRYNGRKNNILLISRMAAPLNKRSCAWALAWKQQTNCLEWCVLPMVCMCLAMFVLCFVIAMHSVLQRNCGMVVYILHVHFVQLKEWWTENYHDVTWVK